MMRSNICVVFLERLLRFTLRIGYLLPFISEGGIRDDEILTHVFGQADANVAYESLLGTGAEILDIAFAGIFWMLEFLKASNEG